MRKLRDDYPLFSRRCLTILDKSGAKQNFVLNRAQLYVHERLEKQRKELGYVRALILKGRQQGMCLDPETPVLTDDLRWIPIKDVRVGQRLVATDEAPILGLGRGNGVMKMRTSVVERVWATERSSYRITFDDGRSVVCSGNHRWLSRKSQPQSAWRSIAGNEGANDSRSALRVGDLVRSVVSVWGESDMDDAWFGGMVDGEGSLDYKTRSGVDLAVSQCDGPVLDRMLSHCTSRAYKYCVVSDDGPRRTKHGLRPVRAISISNIPDVLSLVGRARPVRFVGRPFWEGKRLPDNGWTKIVSIEEVGTMALIDIQTSTGTFLANGFVSHNSTYIAGRFYHNVSMNPGQRAFIVAHEQKATDNLYSMVQRYHELNPIAPSTGKTNAKELVFDSLDGGYKLATAGTKDVGRSNTAQLLHGSEFAFWSNAEAHLAGIGSTIADIPGTEIILESTANGISNKFHQLWQDAEAGKGDWIAIFVPWYWQDEYRAPVKPGFALDGADLEYQEAYGLDLEQMQWRANKIATYGAGFEWLFDQEYPAIASLAFQSPTSDPIISPSRVALAINSKYKARIGPLVIGCDPAEFGDDRTAIVFRQGRLVSRIETYTKQEPMEIAARLSRYWDEFRPDALFVDRIGIGAGIVSRLRELNVPVIGINSGERAQEPDLYYNQRAEMWYRMQAWFADTPVRIPNDLALASDLSGPAVKYNSMKNLRMVEKKDDMKKRGIRSPDIADALALTFSAVVIKRNDAEVLSGGVHMSGHKPATAAGY